MTVSEITSVVVKSFSLKGLVILAGSLLLSACGDSEPKIEGRWYAQSQVDRGKSLFVDNCAQCHGVAAQGTRNWNKPQANGKYPPPPLNGQAHAWHHPLKGLKQSISRGGIAIGGSMPGFADKLSDDETEAVISYFQSKWPESTYQAWIDRGGLN